MRGREGGKEGRRKGVTHHNHNGRQEGGREEGREGGRDLLSAAGHVAVLGGQRDTVVHQGHVYQLVRHVQESA